MWIVSEFTVGRIKAYSLILSSLISCTEQILTSYPVAPIEANNLFRGGVGKGHPLVPESHEELAAIVVSLSR